MSIDGTVTKSGSDTSEVTQILDRFPAAAENPSLFFLLCLKRRCVWVSQLPEDKQHELMAFLRDVTSLDRRRREIANNLKDMRGIGTSR